MGEIYEVSVWTCDEYTQQYHYKKIWEGSDCLRALEEMARAARAGNQCIRLLYAPELSSGIYRTELSAEDMRGDNATTAASD